MAPIGTARLATCVVAAALVGVPAAVVPEVAAADEGPGATSPVPGLATPATAVDIPAVIDETADAVEEEAIAEALATAAADAETVADDATSESGQEVGDPGATTPAAGDEMAADGASAGSTPHSSGDTTASEPDTVTDTAAAGPVSAPTAAAQPTGALQSSPSNVNVSVRIDSPGDDGSVTQVNVAAASSATAAPLPSGTAASPRQETGVTRPSPAVSSGATTTISPADESPDTWSWRWDCISAPELSSISASGSTPGSIPANWTWIWNCGENDDQYQNATAAQYQPVNVNVSIRVSSPGNNGPVSQSNVAVAVSSGGARSGTETSTTQSTTTVVPDFPTSSVLGAVLFPGSSSLPALPSLPAVLSPFVADAPSASVGIEIAGLVVERVELWVDEPLTLPFVLVPSPADGPVWPGEQGQLSAPRLGAGPDAAWAGPLLHPPLAAGDAAAPHRSAGIAVGPRSERTSDGPTRAERAPRWRTPAPTSPLPESAPSGTSAAPSTAGASSGGGIPIFLALPFLAAMLDLARRVALDRGATPSEHRSRMPDTPG